jgi:hypothetical protein
MRITILACCALTAVTLSAQSGSAASSDIPDAALCKLAIVNPVSGYAECVQPPGAPVDPPPPRPAVVLTVYSPPLATVQTLRFRWHIDPNLYNQNATTLRRTP